MRKNQLAYVLALVSETAAARYQLQTNGREIKWAESVRYLGVHIISAK